MGRIVWSPDGNLDMPAQNSAATHPLSLMAAAWNLKCKHCGGERFKARSTVNDEPLNPDDPHERQCSVLFECRGCGKAVFCVEVTRGGTCAISEDDLIACR